MRYLFVVLFFLSASAVGESISYSVCAKAGLVTVNDPDGSADNTSAFSPGIKIRYDLPRRGSRAFLGIEQLGYELDPSLENIGQEVEGYQLVTGYEREWPVSRVTSIWFGAALNYGEYDFKYRFTVDEEGFLNESFKDRSESVFGVSLNADIYFTLSKNFKVAVGPFIDFPVTTESNIFGGLALTLSRQ